MRGDKILVQDKHRRAATAIARIILPSIMKRDGRYAVSIGGESGSGKSELAVALQQELRRHDLESVILQQDDYFVFPPRTNDRKRRQDISHVGLSEVRLDWLDDNVRAAVNNARTINKPLVIYQEDKITQETLSLDGVSVIIAEGTYTTLLKNIHTRVFINQTYIQTRRARLHRNREPPDPFLEQVLEIEHRIISTHLALANIVINSSFEVAEQLPNDASLGSLDKSRQWP